MKWHRSGDGWTTVHRGHQGIISRSSGPFGDMYSVTVDGRPKGGCGGGTSKSALSSAKQMFLDEVTKLEARKAQG